MGNEQTWIKRLLFATDFSHCAYHAEEHAAFLSQAYGATVDVVHVLELYPGVYAAVEDHSETDERLQETVRRLQRSTVPVTGHQLIGIPSVQICEAAMKFHADLIVLGTRGKTGLDHFLLGSTAERVLTIAPCPVLTVRVPKGRDVQDQKAPITFKQIVVPVDFSLCSLDALEYGTQIAMDFGASLELLHVLEPVAYDDDRTLAQQAKQDQLKEGIDAQFRRYVSAIQAAGVSVREVIRGGVPADTILESARASAGDLIVMGTHGRRGISYVMRGSVAEAVLRRASCPVLAVRNAHFGANHQRVVPMETTT
ncbi:MAG: universal stress protein [Nitrospirota bacterium]